MSTEPQPAGGPSIADTIIQLENERIRALLAGDIAQLHRLHASDYQLVTPSGRTFDRAQYIESIASGDLHYLRWDAALMNVIASQAMAALRYQVTLQLGSPQTPGTPMHCWHTDMYVLRDGTWQAVWSQATLIRG
jgi:hypothetical protein